MSNKNLSEAAMEILNASKAKAPKAEFGDGFKPSVKAPQQQELEIGTAGHKSTDSNYDATKGVPTATPPGTTPPVGSESMKKLASQPQETSGRKDLANSPEGGETSDETIKNRGKGPTPTQTMPSNPGSVTKVSEEELGDSDFEEEYEEATLEEVEQDLNDLSEEEFEEKYNMQKSEASEKLQEMKEAENDLNVEFSVKEDIDAMLSGENLSEAFKEKATVIFESAVKARVEIIAEELENRYSEEFETALESVKQDFAEKLDSYLDYVVENWMEENKLAIEKGLRSEIVEDFIGALKNVFVEHYIDIPEDKVDVVEELVSKVEELEGQVNEQILKNIDLKKSLSEQKKEDCIRSVCEGLTISQAEKIRSLAKNVEFVSEEDYNQKLIVIRESYSTGVTSKTFTPAKVDSLNEAVELDDESPTKVVDPLIESYAKRITKLTKF